MGGPLAVSDPVSVHPLLDGWVEAAAQAGHPLNADFNGLTQDGVGRHQMTQPRGMRCSSANAFLDPHRHRPNLTIATSTLALRLRFDGTTAIGVELDHHGEVRFAAAEREIVLSLGAYSSPHLLLQSGVGPADELTAGGITPLHDLPDVGRHLQDHAGCFLSFVASVPPVLGPDTSAEEARLRTRGDGPMAWTEVGGSPAFLAGRDRSRSAVPCCARHRPRRRSVRAHGTRDLLRALRRPAAQPGYGDSRLRVIGLDNVRVADTSIMPTLVTGNTNAPAIMIGERAAAFLAVD